jgi:multidrug efflux system membrane fusion protein
MNDMKKTLTMLLLAIITTGCGAKKQIEQTPQAVQTQKMEPDTARSDSGFRFSAVVKPDTEVPLSFRIPGYVIALKQVRGQDGRMRDIAEGDQVAQGAVLARIREVEYQDKVRQASSQAEAAEADAQKAKLDFERATRLFGSDSLTKPDFDAARAHYDAAQAELRAAQAQTAEAQVSLRDTTLVAPFSGEIVKKAVDMGAFVGPGVQTFAIANTETVKIIVGVPDTVVGSIKLGQPVELSVDAFPARTFHARISRISSAADAITRNFDIEVAIPNHERLLKVGMIGSLQLANNNSETQPSSLTVPLSAIVLAKDGRYGVFVVADSSAGEVARLRSVETGGVNGTEIAIVSGLAGGDRIITTGANLLRDGQRVEVLQ